MNEARAAAQEAAAALVVAAIGDEPGDAAEALAAPGADARLVAVEAAAIAARALFDAHGSAGAAYDAACRQLAEARAARYQPPGIG